MLYLSSHLIQFLRTTIRWIPLEVRTSQLNSPFVDSERGNSWVTCVRVGVFQTVADEGSNIPKHVNKLLEWYEKIILANDPEFTVTNTMFKSIITNSLPSSWDTFTSPYVRRRTGIAQIDYETRIPASKLIGIINEEYDRRQSKSPAIANTLKYKLKEFTKPTLQQRIGKPPQPPIHQRMGFKPKWCSRCKSATHNTIECRNAGTDPCAYCGKYGHIAGKGNLTKPLCNQVIKDVKLKRQTWGSLRRSGNSIHGQRRLHGHGRGHYV